MYSIRKKALWLYFLLTIVSKNLPKIKVSRKYKKFNDTALFSFATGTKFTGSTLAPAPPYADSVIYGYANAMQTTHSGRQINAAKLATTTEKSERNILLAALDENANYAESMANKAAVAAGDVNTGYTLISALGFQVAGKSSAKRIIGFVNAGIGWAHAHEAKTVKGYEGHIWEGGPTSVKGVPSTNVKYWFTLESDIIFSDIPSGTVFAYRHASVIPFGHKTSATGSSIISNLVVTKLATLLTVSKGKHPVVDITNVNIYTFGEWRYIIIP
jgi:hypothetical protein